MSQENYSSVFISIFIEHYKNNIDSKIHNTFEYNFTEFCLMLGIDYNNNVNKDICKQRFDNINRTYKLKRIINDEM